MACKVPGGEAAMIVEACTAVCQYNKYSLAGIEYGGECCEYWLCFNERHRLNYSLDCDNALRNGITGPAPDSPSNLYCNMVCNGNSSESEIPS